MEAPRKSPVIALSRPTPNTWRFLLRPNTSNPTAAATAMETVSNTKVAEGSGRGFPAREKSMLEYQRATAKQTKTNAVLTALWRKLIVPYVTRRRITVEVPTRVRTNYRL